MYLFLVINWQISIWVSKYIFENQIKTLYKNIYGKIQYGGHNKKQKLPVIVNSGKFVSSVNAKSQFQKRSYGFLKIKVSNFLFLETDSDIYDWFNRAEWSWRWASLL